MRQFFLGVPKEFEEAAAIDGAGPLRTFFLIMVPQARSTIVSLAIIVFSASWNDYFTPFIMINNTQKMPLPVGILAIRQPFATGDQFELAAIVLSVLPVLIIFIIGQKGIIKSMIQAGIKG
jgi:multiple sugar transport system permease protein